MTGRVFRFTTAVVVVALLVFFGVGAWNGVEGTEQVFIQRSIILLSAVGEICLVVWMWHTGRKGEVDESE